MWSVAVRAENIRLGKTVTRQDVRRVALDSLVQDCAFLVAPSLRAHRGGQHIEATPIVLPDS